MKLKIKKIQSSSEKSSFVGKTGSGGGDFREIYEKLKKNAILLKSAENAYIERTKSLIKKIIENFGDFKQRGGEPDKSSKKFLSKRIVGKTGAVQSNRKLEGRNVRVSDSEKTEMLSFDDELKSDELKRSSANNEVSKEDHHEIEHKNKDVMSLVGTDKRREVIKTSEVDAGDEKVGDKLKLNYGSGSKTDKSHHVVLGMNYKLPKDYKKEAPKKVENLSKNLTTKRTLFVERNYNREIHEKNEKIPEKMIYVGNEPKKPEIPTQNKESVIYADLTGDLESTVDNAVLVFGNMKSEVNHEGLSIHKRHHNRASDNIQTIYTEFLKSIKTLSEKISVYLPDNLPERKNKKHLNTEKRAEKVLREMDKIIIKYKNGESKLPVKIKELVVKIERLKPEKEVKSSNLIRTEIKSVVDVEKMVRLKNGERVYKGVDNLKEMILNEKQISVPEKVVKTEVYSHQKPEAPLVKVSVEEMIERVERMVNNSINKTSFREVAHMRLSPPELGRVEVEIIKEDSKLQIVFRVETMDAKDMVEKKIDQLAQRLTAQGFSVDRMEVRLDRNYEEENRDWREGDEGGERREEGKRRREEKDKRGDEK